jgi:hypothetical protein
MNPDRAGVQHVVRYVNYANLILRLDKDEEFINYLTQNPYSKKKAW